MSIGYVLALQD